MTASILIVDDDSFQREELTLPLEEAGYEVHCVGEGKEAVEFCRQQRPEVVLLDHRMPGLSGMEVLAQLRQEDNDSGVIMMTGFGDIQKAVEAMQLGAENYLPKPVEVAHLLLQVARTAEKVQLRRKDRAARKTAALDIDTAELHGVSPKMVELRQQLQMLTRAPDATVLFLGESGSGKGYFARWLHRNGMRSEMPFVEMNCASFSSSLLESELFGYEKGAFTDAKIAKKGLFEVAHTGVIFLDEIGDLPLALQPKLLTALEDRRFRRVGGLHSIQIDVQFFAATNQDLKAKVEQGLFRADLYYRLNVLPIALPSLRERVDDILLLANGFYASMCRKHGRPPLPLSSETAELLSGYSWPGNIRELRNVLERAFILGGYSGIEARHLPPEFRALRPTVSRTEPAPVQFETLEEMEKRHILGVLDAVGGNVTETSRILAIGRSTLFQKLKKYRGEPHES